VTCRPCGAKPQVKGLKGRAAGPTPWPVGHTLSEFRLRPGGYVHTSVHKSILCPRVNGNQKEWPTGHVDGHPGIRHLQTNSIKSVEAPLNLYIRILKVEFTHTTLFLELSTFKGSNLVVEAQAKPCEGSRVESSLRSSSRSSLGDR
jgi:hypothetical protein